MRTLAFIMPVLFAGLATTATFAFAAPTNLGRFEAASTTANAYTGAITVTARQITGALGQTYDVEPFGQATGKTKSAGDGQTFADLLSVDAGTPVVLLKVRGEKIAPSAPNGGLCDAAPTTFLAYASVAGELRLAAFKGATMGAGARAEDLCGTYNYMR
jgi:hypothetical protein